MLLSTGCFCNKAARLGGVRGGICRAVASGSMRRRLAVWYPVSQRCQCVLSESTTADLSEPATPCSHGDTGGEYVLSQAYGCKLCDARAAASALLRTMRLPSKWTNIHIVGHIEFNLH